MSFDPRIPRIIKARMPGVRRGYLIPKALHPIRRQIYRRLADPDFVAVQSSLLAQSWVAAVRRRMPVYSWTIRTADERRQSEVHADALIWEGDGRPGI